VLQRPYESAGIRRHTHDTKKKPTPFDAGSMI
jgi:hypothetical protein